MVLMKIKLDSADDKGESSSDDEAMDFLFEHDGLKGRRLSAF